MEYLVNNKTDSDGNTLPCPLVTSCLIYAPDPNVCKIDFGSGNTCPKKGCLIKIG